MLLSSVTFIQGLSLGLEHIDASPEDGLRMSIIFDFFVLRFIFSATSWTK